MSKKHFISLADALRPVVKGGMSADALKALLNWCREQNPNFNEARWLAYLRGECGPNGGQHKA